MGTGTGRKANHASVCRAATVPDARRPTAAHAHSSDIERYYHWHSPSPAVNVSPLCATLTAEAATREPLQGNEPPERRHSGRTFACHCGVRRQPEGLPPRPAGPRTAMVREPTHRPGADWQGRGGSRRQRNLVAAVAAADCGHAAACTDRCAGQSQACRVTCRPAENPGARRHRSSDRPALQPRLPTLLRLNARGRSAASPAVLIRLAVTRAADSATAAPSGTGASPDGPARPQDKPAVVERRRRRFGCGGGASRAAATVAPCHVR